MLAAEFRAMFGTDETAFRESTAAARVNGYVAGDGTRAQLAREVDLLGLTDTGRSRLISSVDGSGDRNACSIAHDGQSTTLSVLKPGEMFGEMAVFGHKPRSASAQAVGATECKLVSETEFREMAGGPEVWMLLDKMSQRIREVDEHIEKMNLENLGRQSALSQIRLRRSSFE